DAAIEGPAIERNDAFLEFGVAAGFGRQGLELGDAIEDVLGAGADFFVNGLLRIKRELLRKVADDKVAAGRDGAAVRGLQAGDNFEEGGLAGTVAPDHADAVAVFKGEGSAVEDDLLLVTDHEVRGDESGRHAAGTYTRNVQMLRARVGSFSAAVRAFGPCDEESLRFFRALLPIFDCDQNSDPDRVMENTFVIAWRSKSEPRWGQGKK